MILHKNLDVTSISLYLTSILSYYKVITKLNYENQTKREEIVVSPKRKFLLCSKDCNVRSIVILLLA